MVSNASPSYISYYQHHCHLILHHSIKPGSITAFQPHCSLCVHVTSQTITPSHTIRAHVRFRLRAHFRNMLVPPPPPRPLPFGFQPVKKEEEKKIQRPKMAPSKTNTTLLFLFADFNHVQSPDNAVATTISLTIYTQRIGEYIQRQIQIKKHIQHTHWQTHRQLHPAFTSQCYTWPFICLSGCTQNIEH